MDFSEKLEKGYKIAFWKDDPWSLEGRKRYEIALKKFRGLIEHPWLKELLKLDNIGLLDIGAGKGIGGVALAKTLIQQNCKVKLVMIDLRKSAVEDSLKFANEEKVEAEAFQMNAIEAHKLGKFNIVLMYGAILAHFDWWSLARLFASATMCLKEKGVIIIEEFDRVHAIFTAGFKNLIIENPRPDKLSISVHAGYDVIKGSYLRNFIRVKDWEVVTLPVNFRNISSIAAMLWLFVEDVDVASVDEENVYFVLGRESRNLLKPNILANSPKILKRNSPWNISS